MKPKIYTPEEIAEYQATVKTHRKIVDAQEKDIKENRAKALRQLKQELQDLDRRNQNV